MLFFHEKVPFCIKDVSKTTVRLGEQNAELVLAQKRAKMTLPMIACKLAALAKNSSVDDFEMMECKCFDGVFLP